MRILDTLAMQVIAWAVAISLILFTLLGSAALIQNVSRSDHDVCVAHGGSFTYDSTSPVANSYKETCSK